MQFVTFISAEVERQTVSLRGRRDNGRHELYIAVNGHVSNMPARDNMTDAFEDFGRACFNVSLDCQRIKRGERTRYNSL